MTKIRLKDKSLMDSYKDCADFQYLLSQDRTQASLQFIKLQTILSSYRILCMQYILQLTK